MSRYPVTDHPQCSIMHTLAAFRDYWCLYAVFSNEPHHINRENPAAPFYLGVCKLRDVIMMPDAFRNTKFREVRDADNLMLQIIKTCPSEMELHNIRTHLIKQSRPLANVFGYSERSSRTIITCTQGPMQGETFNTQAEAARRCGVSQGAISNHLNGVPGYEAVRGCKFIRGLPQEG